MGWISDAVQPEGGGRSLGSVARLALAHPAWPSDSKPQARSLAALLSKLDRGLELEWLADRPAVQHVLAEVLGIPRSRLAENIGDGVAESNAARHRIRFDDLPFASPLDLTTEPLPPGMPDAVIHPGTWSKTWWRAPAGSGRSLVGAWLKARRLATFVSAPDWATAEPQLPGDGAVFVELWSDVGDHRILPPRDSICIAAPFAPTAVTESPWFVVESPNPSTWLDALVRWLALRLPRDGHFVPDRALEWLRGENERGAIETLGAALGLAGLIDQYGVRELERQGFDSLVARFVRERLAAVGEENGSDTRWLAENAPEVLVRLGARLLTDSPIAWNAPRPFEEWVRLVPREYQELVDPEWVRVSLSRGASPSVSKEVERAVRELPPGAFRVVRGLERAGLLRAAGGEKELALAPCWLAQRTLALAEEKTVQGDPHEWGGAILERRVAGNIVRAIVARATRGDFTSFEDALDLEDATDPTLVAAVETSLRAVGIALLAGTEVPADVTFGLWNAAVPLIVERDSGPHPRLDHAATNAEDPLLHVGIYRLAALAISETIPDNRGLRHAVLRPWGRDPDAPGLTSTLDSIWAAVSAFNLAQESWAVETFALTERLLGRSGARAEVHALEWPGRVLAQVREGSLQWNLFKQGASAVGVAALFAVATRRGVALRAVIHDVWLAWAIAPEALMDDSPLSPKSAHSKAFFGHVPVGAMRLLFTGEWTPLAAFPYETLDESAWPIILDVNPTALAGVSAAWRAIPEPLVGNALRLGRPTRADISQLWARVPDALQRVLDEALSNDDLIATDLLHAAPASRATVITEGLRTLLHEEAAHPLGTATRNAVREWLHESIRNREPGWRSAFEVLGRV